MQANSQKLTSFRDFWNGSASEKGTPHAFAQVANMEDAVKEHLSTFTASFFSKSCGNLSISAQHLARPPGKKPNTHDTLRPSSALKCYSCDCSR